MRLVHVHDFAASPSRVLEAMVDIELHKSLELASVDTPEVLERVEHDGRTRLVLRYTYVGDLDPIVRRLLGNGLLRFDQTIEVEPATSRGSVAVSSLDSQPRLRADATITFEDLESGTRRHIEGDLRVSLPLVGRAAERNIATGLTARFDTEAAGVDAWLSS